MVKKKVRQIHVCPNCGSTNLKGSRTMNPQDKVFFNVRNNMLVYGKENINFYGCGDCGYYGIAPKISTGNLEEFRAQVKKRKNFNSPGINKSKPSRKIISFSVLIIFLFSFLALIFQGQSNLLLILGMGIGFLGIVLGTILFYLNKKKSKIKQ